MTRGAGSWMRAELAESPEVVARVIDGEAESAVRLGVELRRRGVRLAVIAARGSSDHAALFGKYALEWAVGVPVALAAPSMTTLYRRPLRLKDALVIGISQSGRSPDVVEFLSGARDAGALTLAVTNEPGSPLAAAARRRLLCRAGPERSVAATKTFSAQMAGLGLLAAAWAGGRRQEELLSQLRVVPGALEGVLALEPAVDAAAEVLARARRCLVLARGFALAAALETALKLKESAGLFAEGLSAADFLHGPAAMVSSGGRGLAALVLAPSGAGLASVRRAVAVLRRGKVRWAAFADSPRLLRLSSAGLALPKVPEWLSPFPLACAGQLLAWRVARLRGLDPDRPAGLRKVTKVL